MSMIYHFLSLAIFYGLIALKLRHCPTDVELWGEEVD